MLKEIVSSPVFGVTLTVLIFWIFTKIYAWRTWPLFSPLLAAPLAIIGVLLTLNIPYSAYQKGGNLLAFFIGPSTVALAVPLYRHLPNLRKRLAPVIVAITAGSLTGIISAVLLTRLLGGEQVVAVSMAAKSTTAPIAIGITEKLGGNTALVIISVVVTGILGGVLGPEFLRLLGIRDKTAIGLGIGTASHVGGTSRAIQLGDVEGSMSGAAIALAGVVTAMTAPIVVHFLIRFF